MPSMTTTHTTTSTFVRNPEAPINPQDLHIVVAALNGIGTEGFIGYVAVTAPLTYEEALKVWEQKERVRSERSSLKGKGAVGHVREYAVRSLADPRFAPTVGRGFTNRVNRKTGRPTYETDSSGGAKVKAAKEWAKLYGYQGREGGWIYNPGNAPVTQGWASFANWVYRQGGIAKGADGAWYVIDREVVA